jgi:hypothetical protein
MKSLVEILKKADELQGKAFSKFCDYLCHGEGIGRLVVAGLGAPAAIIAAIGLSALDQKLHTNGYISFSTMMGCMLYTGYLTTASTRYKQNKKEQIKCTLN